MYIKGVRYIIVLMLFSLSACNGYTYMSSVPAVPVQYVLNVLADDPTFVPANTGAYKIVKQKRFETDYIGYAGLLIYIGFDSQYHAFDLACPHCLNRQNTVEMNGMFAVCPICHEEYDVSYGYATPTTGKTKEPLRKYHCSWNGTTLTVGN